MPVIKNIQENNCQIAIWKMNKSLDDLIKLSNKIDNLKFKTEKRKNEFLSSRLLLNKLLPNTIVSYNTYGAPEIDDDNFISISHSKNLTAIIISKNKVGLDIEKISEKALKLSSKFIAKDQHKPLSKEKATLIWCCKETVYKWFQKGKINFVADIKINPFIIKDEGSLIVEFRNQQLTLYYKKINEHFLVYLCK